jgi:phosphatidylglycerophosphatase A
MSAAVPSLRFLFARPAHFVALGFGAGLAPVAPGTFGTLVAIPIAMGLHAYAPDAVYLAVVAAFLGVGIWAAAITGRDLGVPDHGAIVCDEVVAFLLVLFFVNADGVSVALAFLLFRLHAARAGTGATVVGVVEMSAAGPSKTAQLQFAPGGSAAATAASVGAQ